MTNPTADERVNTATTRNDDKTQIRGFTNAPPLTAQAGHLDTDALALNVSALPLNLDSLPPQTNSDWVDPNPQAPAPETAVGSLLGNRYLLEYKVGEGGMGVVYRATDVEVKGEIFAVKVLKPAIQQRPEALKLMREEVRKTRGLKHPNIVGVYSLNSDPSGAYMLMEFLEGKSLSTLIDEEFGRGMPLMRAWPLINDIGSALAYAHDHNVIHSDLKPSNLFVTVSGKAMLLDFGIARAVRARADRFDTGSLGALTPAYATSEMIAGNTPDQSDDVYSFACVIYEMLSGKHPFNSLGAVDAKRVGSKLMPLPTLTHRQNQALAHALAFDRAQRTASVEALLAGLRGPGRRPPPPRWIWPAAGAAACLVAGTVAWLMWHGRAPEHQIASATPVVANTPPAAVPMAPQQDSVAHDTPAEKPREKLTSPAATAPPPPLREATGATLAAAPSPANPVHHPALPDAKPLPAPAIPPSSTPPEGAAAGPDVATVSPTPSSGSAAAPDASDAASIDAPPAAPAAHIDTGGAAPIGKKVPAIIPLPDAAAKLASCPYPEEARRQVETGTVVLLVYVSAQGAAANTQIESSSGSTSLDQGAVSCVQEFGQFAPHLSGKRASGYWGRMKFNWSFGE